MTPEIRKHLELFIADSERVVSDLHARVGLARYLIAEPNTLGLPRFPTGSISSIGDVLKGLTVIDYLQNIETTARRSA